MRTYPFIKHAFYGLALIACANLSFAEEDKKQTEEKEQAPPAPVLTKKPPIYEPPALKPLKPLAPAPQPIIQKKKQPAKQDKKKTADKQANKPAAAKPPLRQPPAGQRPAGTAIQLEKISTAHLSPAMLWHLQRAGVAVEPLPGAVASPANYAGEQKFYPGVSRLPDQKPFVGMQRPPTAFDRYWPLLLEGRQDPNTGFIIWRLP